MVSIIDLFEGRLQIEHVMNQPMPIVKDMIDAKIKQIEKERAKMPKV